jgi:hypothetical protein
MRVCGGGRRGEEERTDLLSVVLVTALEQVLV